MVSSRSWMLCPLLSRTQKCNKELWNYRGCELNGKQSEWVQAKVWIIVDGATICCQLRIVHVPEQIKNAGTGISVVGVMHFIIIIVGILFFCFPVNTWPSACLPASKRKSRSGCVGRFLWQPQNYNYILSCCNQRGLGCLVGGWLVQPRNIWTETILTVVNIVRRWITFNTLHRSSSCRCPPIPSSLVIHENKSYRFAGRKRQSSI